MRKDIRKLTEELQGRGVKCFCSYYEGVWELWEAINGEKAKLTAYGRENVEKRIDELMEREKEYYCRECLTAFVVKNAQKKVNNCPHCGAEI